MPTYGEATPHSTHSDKQSTFNDRSRRHFTGGHWWFLETKDQISSRSHQKGLNYALEGYNHFIVEKVSYKPKCTGPSANVINRISLPSPSQTTLLTSKCHWSSGFWLRVWEKYNNLFTIFTKSVPPLVWCYSIYIESFSLTFDNFCYLGYYR